MGSKKKGQKQKPGKRRLKTLSDVRRFLSDVTNALNRGEMDATKAGKLGYLVQILAKIIQGDDLERRVLSIEEALRKAKEEV